MTTRHDGPAPASWLPTEDPAGRLPEPDDVAAFEMRDGALIVVRRLGRASGPRLVLSHGNGMAIDAYAPFWRPLLAHCEVLLLDLRNHGWNPLGAIRGHTLANMVWDWEQLWWAIRARFGPKPTFGVLHSIAALGALHHVLRAGPRWAGLVLFEPPLMPPPGHELEGLFQRRQDRITSFTAGRPAHYPGYGHLAAWLRDAPTFSRLVDEAYDLHAAASLRPDPAGGYRLRCPPEYEAKIYAENLDSTLALALEGLTTPLRVIGGDPDLPDAMTPTVIAHALFPAFDLDYRVVPETTHFLPLEAPERCCELTLDFVERNAG